MALLHLWPIYVGAAALALPVLIHWLTRPRPQRLPLSTLQFVRIALQDRRARHRLRNFVVLALRTAAIALLAWAMARPLLGERFTATAEQDDVATARVVVLDVSESMSAVSGGVQTFERARSQAAEHLKYASGLRANLIRAAARPQPVFGAVSANFDALRDELARAQPRPERLNLAATIASAAELLNDASLQESARRELVIVSDFQRTNWTTADFAPLPADTRILLESVAPATAPDNLAVLAVRCQGQPRVGRETRVEIDVGNYTPAARRVAVELQQAENVRRVEGLCPPGGKLTLSADVIFERPGWQIGQAVLVDTQGTAAEDALKADNARPFAFNVSPPSTFAIITRQSPSSKSSSSYYLERALAPHRPEATARQARVVRLDPARFDNDAALAAELLVLDHPGRLPPEVLRTLAGLLRRGRAILYLTAEPIDAANLSQLADAAGAGLQLPVEFSPAAAAQPRRDLFLTEVSRGEQPFAVFGDGLTAAIAPAKFAGGLSTRDKEGVLRSDVLARFSDRSAALVVSASEGGTLAVWNTDLSRSNLHMLPELFVPLVGELADRLLARKQSGAALASGEPLAVYLPPEAGNSAALRITAENSGTNKNLDEPLGELVEQTQGVLWRAAAAAKPGVYRVVRKSAADGDDPAFAVAIETPPEEADLRTIDAALFNERLAGGREIQFRSLTAEEHARDDLWTYLAVACVGCLLVEVTILHLNRV